MYLCQCNPISSILIKFSILGGKLLTRFCCKGKAKQDLDAYVAQHKDDIKRVMAGGRRPLTSTDKDQERSKLQSLMGQVPAQAAEAWMKLSNDEGRPICFKFLIPLF